MWSHAISQKYSAKVHRRRAKSETAVLELKKKRGWSSNSLELANIHAAVFPNHQKWAQSSARIQCHCQLN